MDPITVLVAHPQEPFRAGLVSILRRESDIMVVGEARDGDEAITKALQLRPRVILMDLNLTLRDGVEAISRIGETLPQVMTVIITDSEREVDVFRALSCGAQGCLLKTSSSADILQTVRRAAAGEVMLSPAIVANLVDQLRSRRTEPNLSQREMEVLGLLGEGLTNHEIAERLFVGENTVKTYVWRLREKLRLNSRLELGMYAARRRSSTKQADMTSVPAVEASAPGPKDSEAGLAPEQDVAAPVGVIGERKPATALSVELDWRADTAETRESDTAREFRDEALDLMAEEVRRYHGSVAWFSANGFIALFGVPVAEEHAPQQALHAAIAILERMKHYGDQLHEGGLHVDTRLGINSGMVQVHGDVDGLTLAHIRAEDTADLATAACGLAEPGTIVVTENTHRLTMGQFAFRPLRELAIKGIGKSIKTYLVLGYAPARSKPEVSAAPGLTRFVGRHKELETLRHIFDEARLGSIQAVGVVGEAGVGKSRLLQQFREGLPPDEFTYIEGSSLNYSDTIPYLPLLQCLRYYFNIAEGDTEATVRGKMEERISSFDNKDLSLLPPLQDILSLKVEDEDHLKLEPAKKKEMIFEAVRNLILMESLSRTVLIALEDCHWTDKPSEALLYYLIDSLSNARVVFVLLYRPEWEHQLSKRSNYSQIGLKELPPDTGDELIGSILGDGEADPALQQFVADRAGGNPLFVEELLRNLRETGCLRKERRKYILAAKPSEIKIPASLQSIIAARIDRLTPDAKHILQVAAVIGRDFSHRILDSLVGVRQELKPSLLSLQRGEFIYGRDLTADPHYVFKHGLTQEVAYQSLRPKTRAELHKRVGRAIERLYPDSLEAFYEALAYHYSRSDDLEKAAQYLELLAEKASRSCSNWEALRLYREAIDALRKHGGRQKGRAKELGVRLAMDGVHRALDYPEGSVENLQEAEELAQELGDAERESVVHSKMGWYHMVRGDAELGLKEIEAAFEEAMQTDNPDLVVPVAVNLTQALQVAGEFRRQIEVASQAVSLLEQTQRESTYCGGLCNENVYCMLLAWRGPSLAHLGEFDEAKAAVEKSLAYARKIDNQDSIAFALHLYGTVCMMRGDGGTAAKYLQEALPHLDKVGNSMVLGGCWGNLGWAHLLQGDYQRAAECLDKGLALHQQGGSSAFLANFFWGKGWMETETSRFSQARVALEESLRLARANKERCTEGIAAIYLGRAMSKGAQADYQQAEQTLIQGMGILDELELKPWHAEGCLFLGELYMDMGHKAKALKAVKEAETSFSEMGMDYWLHKAQDLLRRFEGQRP